jgi:hypothetical protein
MACPKASTDVYDSLCCPRIPATVPTVYLRVMTIYVIFTPKAGWPGSRGISRSTMNASWINPVIRRNDR